MKLSLLQLLLLFYFIKFIKVKIRVIGAKDLIASDASGTSDPYCVVQVNSEKQKTKKCDRNLNPVWNETYSFHCSPTDHATFKIFDWDRFGKDDCLGEAIIHFDALIQGLELHQFLTLAGGKGAIEVGITAEDFSGPRAQNQQQPQQQYHPPQQQYHPPPQQHQQFQPPPQQHHQQGIIGPNGRPVRKPQGITDHEVLDCMAKFRQVDTNHSNTIDHKELKPLLRLTCQTTMNDNLLDRFVNLQMQSVDANRSGQIDFDEFLVLYSKFKAGAF